MSRVFLIEGGRCEKHGVPTIVSWQAIRTGFPGLSRCGDGHSGSRHRVVESAGSHRAPARGQATPDPAPFVRRRVWSLVPRSRDRARAASRAELAARTAAREALRPPTPIGYVTTFEAATKTGVTAKTVLRRAMPLGAVRAGPRWWIPVEAVNEIVRQLRDDADMAAYDAKGWLSLREAAGIIGCDDSTVLTYVTRGAIERRNAPRNRPSLSRPSVERFARTCSTGGECTGTPCPLPSEERLGVFHVWSPVEPVSPAALRGSGCHVPDSLPVSPVAGKESSLLANVWHTNVEVPKSDPARVPRHRTGPTSPVCLHPGQGYVHRD